MGPTSLLSYALGGAALIGLLTTGIQTYRVSDAQRQLAEANNIVIRLQDNNDTLTANETRLKNSVAEQNTQIEALRVAGETRSKAAMEELNRVRETLTARNRVLVTQLAMRRPPPGIEVCVAALDEARRPNT